MKLSAHIIASFSIGAAIWFFTKSFTAALLYFMFGGLLDADHIIEYGLHYGWKDITFMKVYRASQCTNRGKQEGGYSKLHLIFHTAELTLLLWIGYLYTGNIYLFATAMGHSTHLIMDYIGNPIYPLSYFFIWRAMKGFDIDKIVKRKSI